MASETTATTLTELIQREANAASALFYANNLGLRNFVTVKDLTGLPTLTAQFPIYDSVTAAAIAEASDFTTNSALDTSGSVSCTVTEHAIKFTLTDRSLGATVEEIVGNSVSEATAKNVAAGASIAGRAASTALQVLQDGDIAALFSGFNSSTGSNSGAITSTLLMDAIGTLRINNVPPGSDVAVLHPYQWKTLAPVFDDASVFGAQGQEIVNTGSVARLYGATVFQTASVASATVSSSTVYAGAVMTPEAIGLAVKGPMPMFETERDASLRAVELVASAQWCEIEYRGGATTNGRGGAGVYLYSNTTA